MNRSHTWGDEEVTYSEWPNSLDAIIERAGFLKIKNACEQAKKDGYDYLWADTVCIDKSSSAELSEAINSMFAWYAESAICYVYLSDVHITLAPLWVCEGSSFPPAIDSLENSRWFTRGWTLQELLAPRYLFFFLQEWQKIGEIIKETLLPSDKNPEVNTYLSGIYGDYAFTGNISSITRIPLSYLIDTTGYTKASIAKRMFWAYSRQTTRIEDMAYCLLGIFNINMPLLYGEGSKAFTRLQEEIMKVSTDQSIFAWDCTGLSTLRREGDINIIAPSPSAFSNAGDVVICPNVTGSITNTIYNLTNFGLSLRLPVFRSSTLDNEYVLCMLSCRLEQQGDHGRLYLPLRKTIDVANDVLYERCLRPSTVLPISLGSDTSFSLSLDFPGEVIIPRLEKIHVPRIRHDNRNSFWTSSGLACERRHGPHSWTLLALFRPRGAAVYQFVSLKDKLDPGDQGICTVCHQKLPSRSWMPGREFQYFTTSIEVTHGSQRAFIKIHTRWFPPYEEGLMKSICKVYTQEPTDVLEMPSTERWNITQSGPPGPSFDVSDEWMAMVEPHVDLGNGTIMVPVRIGVLSLEERQLYETSSDQPETRYKYLCKWLGSRG